MSQSYSYGGPLEVYVASFVFKCEIRIYTPEMGYEPFKVFKSPGNSKSKYKNERFFNLVVRDRNLYEAIVETSTPESIQ